MLQMLANEFLVPLVSVAAIIAAAWCYFRLPVLGKEATIVLVALSTGLSGYSQGYAARALRDKSAALTAQIDVLNADLTAAKRAAADANVRAGALESRSLAYAEKVADYEKSLGAQAGICALDANDIRRLRSIVGSP